MFEDGHGSADCVGVERDSGEDHAGTVTQAAAAAEA